MTVEKLMGLLAYTGRVYHDNWNTVREVVAIVPSAGVISKSWEDKFKNDNLDWYPLHLDNIGTWSTYEGCVDLVFSNEEGKLVCSATVYDGEMMYGSRRGVRFKAELVLPLSFVRKLESSILGKLDRIAKDAYEDYLEDKRRVWIEEFKSEVLRM